MAHAVADGGRQGVERNRAVDPAPWLALVLGLVLGLATRMVLGRACRAVRGQPASA